MPAFACRALVVFLFLHAACVAPGPGLTDDEIDALLDDKAAGVTPDVDICAERALYGDGHCDWACPERDSDCAWLPEETPDPCADPGPETLERFRHPVSRVAIARATGGSVRHGALEPVIHVGESATLTGRFAYGPLLGRAVLWDETVIAYLGRGSCDWVEVGRARTNNEGDVSFDVPAEHFTARGRVPFHLVVAGDGTRVKGHVWVIEEGAKAVVFDMDKTLTTDTLGAEQIVLGRDPVMRDDADRVVHRHAALGYVPVYLTARPWYMQNVSRRWLEAHHFPPGVVRTSTRTAEGVFAAATQAHKQARLEELAADGLELDRAYGDAMTDICAYARAGIDPARTFIVEENGGRACEGWAATQPITTYRDHLATLFDLSPVTVD